mmetsp:Transcript_18969/g.34367  ORF Transcript_18969/g.34367 Transcript_18969/m.34367 type:complete len:1072 (-) Transcript_18969:2534-5749(-)
MDLQALPVSVIDPRGVWPALQSFVEQRLPITDVEVTDFYSEKLNLQLWFDTNQQPLLWPSSQPYAYVYVLCFEDYSDYDEHLREPFNLWLNTMTDQSTWLILYIPTLSPSKLHQAVFRLNYDRLKTELSKRCESNFIRLYSEKTQTYIDTHHPSSSLDEYWACFMRSLKAKVAFGVESRLRTLLADIEEKLEVIGSSESTRVGILEEYKQELGEGSFVNPTEVPLVSLKVLERMLKQYWMYAESDLDEDADEKDSPRVLADYLEELAEINLMIERPAEAALIYSNLLENESLIDLRQEYAPLNTSMPRHEFKTRYAERTLTQLEFCFYMLRLQYYSLRMLGQVLLLRKRILRFFFENSLRLKKAQATVIEAASWEYLASNFLLELIEEEEFEDDIDICNQLDLAGVLKRYMKSRLERIAFNNLQIVYILPGLEIPDIPPKLKRRNSALESPINAHEEILELTGELIDYYNRTEGNKHKVAPFMAEKALLLQRMGRTSEALAIFRELPKKLCSWPTLKLATMLAQLQCESALGKTQAVVEISAEICKSQAYLTPATLQSVWNCILTAEQECKLPDDQLFTSNISVTPTKLHKGQDLSVTCSLHNPLPFEFDVHSISVNFFKDETIFSVCTQQLKLVPGENAFTLRSKAPGPGVFKHVQLEIQVENVLFNCPPQSTNLVILKTSSVVLGFKLPTLLMLNQTQLCVVSVETKTEEVREGILTLCPSSLLDHCKSIECIIAAPNPARFSLELNSRNEIVLENLPRFTEAYLMLPIYQAASWDDPRFEEDDLETLPTYTFSSIGKHTIQELFNTRCIKQGLSYQLTAAVASKNIRLDFNYLTNEGHSNQIEYILEHKQHFIDPFALSHEFQEIPQGSILKIIVENCAHLPLTVIRCKLDGAQVIEDGLTQPFTLRTGQQLYMVFILGCFNKQILKISLVFSYALTHGAMTRSITEEIDRIFLKQTFSYEKKISLSSFKVEHSGIVSLQQPYLITLVTSTVKKPFIATFALKKIMDWKVDEPVEFLVTSDCTQTIRAWSLSSQNSRIPPPYLVIEGEEFELSCEGSIKFEAPNESLS